MLNVKSLIALYVCSITQVLVIGNHDLTKHWVLRNAKSMLMPGKDIEIRNRNTGINKSIYHMKLRVKPLAQHSEKCKSFDKH